MNADLLSNEELLGLNDDRANAADVDVIPEKPRRKFHKLTDELMLGPRGLPALNRSLHKFAFKPKKKQLSAYERYKKDKYGHSVHFENLTRLLHVYQLWGHEVYPKYKFKDFIPVLAKAASTPRVKDYRREDVRAEVSGQVEIAAADAAAEEAADTAAAEAAAAAAAEADSTGGLFVGDEEDLYTMAGDFSGSAVPDSSMHDNSITQAVEDGPTEAEERDAFLADVTADLESVNDSGDLVKKVAATKDAEKAANETADKAAVEDHFEEDHFEEDDILGSILDEGDEDDNMAHDADDFLAKRQSQIPADVLADGLTQATQQTQTQTQRSQTQPQAQTQLEEDDAYADDILHEMGM